MLAIECTEKISADRELSMRSKAFELAPVAGILVKIDRSFRNFYGEIVFRNTVETVRIDCRRGLGFTNN